MKRDIDLTRQILLDIEGQGSDCATAALRPGVAVDAQERVRYHLRLLIDGGLVKEVDRTTAGVPCVRLTHAGHEFLELARVESRWADAKRVCLDQTGGLSLTVIKSVLVRWSVDATAVEDHRTPRRWRRPAYVRPYSTGVESRYVETSPYTARPYATRTWYEPETVVDDDLRLVRSRETYRTPYRERYHWSTPETNGYAYPTELNGHADDSLPIYVV
ncbi:hypothetical protein Mal64_25450 [Pseudobythopirellula maris]|uniref:Uncharacterized protein n=1 Tax=Pseudobythopirellula maris TaxID=2527991 RepID=A0A5C5ZS34_9BACT|nr:DUF2513 domain-containing protein [Pseudobythopirellula maris]TWT89053.1 hypothetical protein Mal64_25450 [Pseudobythopirellula maris]